MKHLQKWLVLACSVMLFVACDPETKKKVEICNNGVDDTGNGLVDCADPACYGQAGGPQGQLCQSTESRCNDGFDNDGDGLIDCVDPDCATSPDCAGSEICDDGEDNDGDGLIDCHDPDCVDDPACEGVEICDDGEDNNGNGLTDCDDPYCEEHPYCNPAEICNDDIDNDGDDLIDCADPDCIGQMGNGGLCQAVETLCEDGFDNDGDGFTDCEDPDCAADAACQATPEICDNGIDDNGNDLIDCADPSCDGQTGPGGGTCQTVETLCTDGYDNDGDGLVDCADPDCLDSCLAGGSLVITEIMKDPNLVADTVGEWFEITNAAAFAIDLRGLVLFSIGSSGEETHTISAGEPILIQPGAYMVLGNSSNPAVNGNVTVNYQYTGIIFNNTADDSIGIRTASGTVLDEVVFTVADFPHLAGMSMQLDPTKINATDNNDAANWCLPTNKYNAYDMGTPGAVNPSCTRETNCNDGVDNDGNGFTDCADFACALSPHCTSEAAPTPGSLIVTEFIAHPGVGTPNYQYEWFEVKNVTAAAVELNGLTICDDTPTRYCFFVHFGVSTPLPAGGYALFVSDPSLWTAYTGIIYDYGPAIQLHNTADGLQVFSGTQLIDAVFYNADWTSVVAGKSAQFSSGIPQNATENNDMANWCLPFAMYDVANSLYGTPGMDNRDCHMLETICNDGIDNDGNGLTDCADPNCVGETGPEGVVCEAFETTCNDGFDNDGDGLVDCDDPNCAGLMGPGGELCPTTDTVDLTGYYVELYQNGELKQTVNFSGVFEKGKYIVIARHLATLELWMGAFTPNLTAAEVENVALYHTSAGAWQMNHLEDDSARLYSPAAVEIDRANNPANKIRTRQADGSWVDGNTTAGALGAPDAIAGYSHPIYCYEIGEADGAIRLTNFNGNYVMLYIPNN